MSTRKKKTLQIDQEQPVEIHERTENGHKLEVRVFARKIRETFCVKKNCKFYGKHAAQGICHTTSTFTNSADWQYIDEAFAGAERWAREDIDLLRKHYKGKEYLKHLETHVMCDKISAIMHVDEMVRTRREMSLLKAQVERLKRRLADG